MGLTRIMVLEMSCTQKYQNSNQLRHMVESDWTKYRVFGQVPDTKRGKTLKLNALNQTGHNPFLLAQKTENTTKLHITYLTLINKFFISHFLLHLHCSDGYPKSFLLESVSTAKPYLPPLQLFIFFWFSCPFSVLVERENNRSYVVEEYLNVEAFFDLSVGNHDHVERSNWSQQQIVTVALDKSWRSHCQREGKKEVEAKLSRVFTGLARWSPKMLGVMVNGVFCCCWVGYWAFNYVV